MSFSSSAGALVHMRMMQKKHKQEDKGERLESLVVRIVKRRRRRVIGLHGKAIPLKDVIYRGNI